MNEKQKQNEKTFKGREQMKLADIDELKAAMQTLPKQQTLEFLGVYDLINSMPTIDTNKLNNIPITAEVAQAAVEVGKSVANLISAYLKLYEGRQNE